MSLAKVIIGKKNRNMPALAKKHVEKKEEYLK
jgi:hypothetical protein